MKLQIKGAGPTDVPSMLRWLKRHPSEPFYFTWSGNNLLCGFRNDEGDLHAFSASVMAQSSAHLRPVRVTRGSK